MPSTTPAQNRPLAGRPPARPRTTDAHLVLRVCELRGLLRGELADALGVSLTLLSRTNRIPLAPLRRAALRRMLSRGEMAKFDAEGW